jgi:hypothetical protein
MSYSLTSQGVADQLNALYRLADAALQVEADAIRTNFKTWVNDHFALTPAQITCIDKMSLNTLQDFGDTCCFGLKNKLDISYEDPTPAPPAGYKKFVIKENNTKTKTNSIGTSTGSGTIKFKVGYEPF